MRMLLAFQFFFFGKIYRVLSFNSWHLFLITVLFIIKPILDFLFNHKIFYQLNSLKFHQHLISIYFFSLFFLYPKSLCCHLIPFLWFPIQVQTLQTRSVSTDHCISNDTAPKIPTLEPLSAIICKHPQYLSTHLQPSLQNPTIPS